MKRGFPQFVTMCSLSGIYFYKSQCHNCRRNFAITCLLGLFAGFAQAMPFVNLAHPDEILLDDRPTDRVTVAADGTVTLAGGEASFIRLTWKVSLPKDAKIYNKLWKNAEWLIPPPPNVRPCRDRRGVPPSSGSRCASALPDGKSPRRQTCQLASGAAAP